MIISIRQIKPNLLLSWRYPNRRTVLANTLPEVMKQFTVLMGPPGKQGIPGPDGPEGTEGKVATLVWSPEQAQEIWLIRHNLGRFPVITIVDSNGGVVFPELKHVNSSLAEATFAFPMTGYAHIV